MTLPDRFDVAIIGGGPGGYVAAIRAAQLGATVALVEKDRVGGTCLVRGCIPTKALLQSSELYAAVAGQGPAMGVIADALRFDLGAAQRRRIEIVDGLVKGVEGLLKGNGVMVLRGAARLTGSGGFEVEGEPYSAADIVVATGSVPSRPPIPGVEHTVDSDGILDLDRLPESLTVIGGGVVGMEWGALFAALGTRVTVVEMLPQILPMVERDMVGLYRRHFERVGGVIHTDAQVRSIEVTRSGRTVIFAAGGEEAQVGSEVVLMATGRSPFTAGLGLEAAGVDLDRGRIVVDDHLRTAADGVWAIGDVIGGIMLAHVASYEGVLAVENIAGGADRTPDYRAVPNCVYTDPEIATVGLSETDARERGIEVRVGRFPFAALGRAQTLGATEGAVKVVAGADDTILGVQMVGPRVTDVIGEATLAVQQRLKLHDLDLTIHAHPTLPEALLEAALAADGRAIHVVNRRSPAPPQAPTAPASSSPPARNGHARGRGTGSEAAAPAPAAAARRGTAATAVVAPPVTPAAPAPAPGPALELADPAALAIRTEDRDTLLEVLRLMYLIRRFEERAQVEYTRANIGGYCHLNLGEEASVVGGILALRAGDPIFTSYREHGHAIARGVDPRVVMAELFGRETGTSHGRGGSMHIFDTTHRFMGGYGIVGGHLPLATGAAFSARYRGGDEVVFCMFGDGATNIGAFHESLNFAKVLSLPVVWFCINNQYGMGTSVEAASAVPEIHRRAAAYDMEAERVDGMDVLAVLRKSHEFIEKTRADKQPRLLEAYAYRFKGHSVVDPDKYRPDEEKERWRHEDPIVHFELRLEEAGLAGEADLKALRASVEAQVEEAVRFAGESPEPDVSELYRHLYAPAGEAARG